MTVEEAVDILSEFAHDRKPTRLEIDAAWTIFHSVSEEEWAKYWTEYQNSLHAGENI